MFKVKTCLNIWTKLLFGASDTDQEGIFENIKVIYFTKAPCPSYSRSTSLLVEPNSEPHMTRVQLKKSSL